MQTEDRLCKDWPSSEWLCFHLAAHTSRADGTIPSIYSALGPYRPSLRRQIHKWPVLNQLMITLGLGGRCLYPLSPFSGSYFILKSHSVSCPIFSSHSQGNYCWAGYTSRSQGAYGISGNKTKPEASSHGSLRGGLALGSHHRCLPSQ